MRDGRTGWDPSGLEGFIEATPDAMLVADVDGRILLANERAAILFGYERSELIGANISLFALERQRDAQRRRWEAYIREPRVHTMGGTGLTMKARRKDGTEFPVELSLSPMAAPIGLLVVAAVRDNTINTHDERLFRGLLEAAPDAIVIVDRSGVVQLVNAQVEKMFGYEREELVGRAVEVLVPDRFAGMHRAFRQGYLAEPRSRAMGLAGDLFARRKDATEFPVEISLAPLETDDGLLISASVRDMSERRRIHEEADRVKDEFFATVSHELRTPLTSMIGYSEMMAEMEELTPQGRRFLSVISRSAARELRLVDDLLTLVAIEESGLSIRTNDVDLEAVVREAVEGARPPAEEAGLVLSLETPGYAVPLTGDKDRLGQAVDNLLSNAIKFTPAGGRVRVVLRTGPRFVEIDVIDTGPGIGEVDPDRLFERLFRASDAVARQVPGAGLGLTIAQAMIEAHHGSIEVARSGSDGTVFRIRLPLS